MWTETAAATAGVPSMDIDPVIRPASDQQTDEPDLDLVLRTESGQGTNTPPQQSSPSDRARLWIWLEQVMFVIGVACLGYYAYVSVETRLYQELENRELDQILASPPPFRTPAPAPTPLPLPPPAPGSMVGRIEIPRLGVSAIIRAGSDARTLRLAVGHIPGTALPGEIGNIGLAGHRDTFFRRLRDIRPSDDIRVVTKTGRFTYTVDATKVVWPKDTWVLNPTRTSTLTLVTCYPFTYVGSAPQRFIVHAVASGSPTAMD